MNKIIHFAGKTFVKAGNQEPKPGDHFIHNGWGEQKIFTVHERPRQGGIVPYLDEGNWHSTDQFTLLEEVTSFDGAYYRSNPNYPAAKVGDVIRYVSEAGYPDHFALYRVSHMEKGDMGEDMPTIMIPLPGSEGVFANHNLLPGQYVTLEKVEIEALYDPADLVEIEGRKFVKSPSRSPRIGRYAIITGEEYNGVIVKITKDGEHSKRVFGRDLSGDLMSMDPGDFVVLDELDENGVPFFYYGLTYHFRNGRSIIATQCSKSFPTFLDFGKSLVGEKEIIGRDCFINLDQVFLITTDEEFLGGDQPENFRVNVYFTCRPSDVKMNMRIAKESCFADFAKAVKASGEWYVAANCAFRISDIELMVEVGRVCE